MLHIVNRFGKIAGNNFGIHFVFDKVLNFLCWSDRVGHNVFQWANLGLFLFIFFLIKNNLMWDSNSNLQKRRQASWPLDHHHCHRILLTRKTSSQDWKDIRKLIRLFRSNRKVKSLKMKPTCNQSVRDTLSVSQNSRQHPKQLWKNIFRIV